MPDLNMRIELIRKMWENGTLPQDIKATEERMKKNIEENEAE